MTSPDEPALNLGRGGAERFAAAMRPGELADLLQFSETVLQGQSGRRVFDRAEVIAVLGPAGSIGRCAAAILGKAARSVRAILFDKTSDNKLGRPLEA